MQLINIAAAMLLIPQALALPIQSEESIAHLPCSKPHHKDRLGHCDDIAFDHEVEDNAEILPLRIDPIQPVNSHRTQDRKRLEPIQYYTDIPASGNPPENDGDFPPDDSSLGALGQDGNPLALDSDGQSKDSATLPCPKEAWPTSFGIGPACDPKLRPLDEDVRDDPNEPHITLP